MCVWKSKADGVKQCGGGRGKGHIKPAVYGGTGEDLSGLITASALGRKGL